jgi:plasmid stabilization system protein ParE
VKARFTPEAEVELHAEARYYEQQVAGLGKRFTHEIEAALALACSFPEIGSAYKYGTRRVYPKRFPFSVVYRLLGEEIVVVAIAPFSRKPGYWRARADVA